jgi:hypothetical protein
MLVYPQPASGALSQFPVQRRHNLRTLVNAAADGTVIKLADPGAETMEWQLNYAALSDAELAALQQFFSAAEGTLNSFTFLDPMGNLLAWSNDLSDAVWDKAPLLSSTGGNADPAGGTNAWRMVNGGAGAQDLSQTVAAPGGYLYCFSVYAKSAAPATVTLLLGGNRHDQILSTGWQRMACTGTGDAAASSVTFGVEFGAGAAVDLYGLQVEPQASPSLYMASTGGGCYEAARLRDDALAFTTMDVNRHSATVNVFYASHL